MVFLPKICVDTPVQCSFNMKNQQVRKHTVKTTQFYSRCKRFPSVQFCQNVDFFSSFSVFAIFSQNNAKFRKTSMNRRAYIFSEKIQNWIPEWLCSKSIHFPSKRTIILCFVEVILYGIFVVFICISIFKNRTKKVGFQAILLGRKSQELWDYLEKVWFFMITFGRLSTVGYFVDIDEKWFPLVYRTLIWHETHQNLSRRTRFVTKRHRSFAISSPFHVLQAGSFYKMYQLFVKVNTLLSGSFTQNHTFLPL